MPSWILGPLANLVSGDIHEEASVMVAPQSPVMDRMLESTFVAY